MDRLTNFLVSMRLRGVRIWIDGQYVRYRAPRGELAADDVSELRALKPQIIQLYRRHNAADPRPTPRRPSDTVPLTFTQMYLCNDILMNRRRKMEFPSAIRLFGPLRAEVLNGAFAELVDRHESLRTRVVEEDGVQLQSVREQPPFDLEIMDLTAVSKDAREGRARRLIKDLTNGIRRSDALFDAKLLRFDDEDNLLVIFWDFLIYDGSSVGILWRDVLTLYAQSVRPSSYRLPEMPVQFPDYALWQQRTNVAWEETHGSYWRDRLAGAQRVRLITDDRKLRERRPAWEFLPFRFDQMLCEKMQSLGRSEGTSMVMSFLAAYAAAISRWCDTADLVIPFITMGRHFAELENVIGSFGAPLFLRLEFCRMDTFRDLLRKVSEEYAAAYRHDDLCRIAAQSPEPLFARNPRFNWIPHDFGMDHAEKFKAIRVGTADMTGTQRFDVEVDPDDCQLDEELRTILSDVAGGISGIYRYRSDRISRDAIMRFGRTFQQFAERMALTPSAYVMSMDCVS